MTSDSNNHIKSGRMSAMTHEAMRKTAAERGLPTITIIDKGASYKRLIEELGAEEVRKLPTK